MHNHSVQNYTTIRYGFEAEFIVNRVNIVRVIQSQIGLKRPLIKEFLIITSLLPLMDYLQRFILYEIRKIDEWSMSGQRHLSTHLN